MLKGLISTILAVGSMGAPILANEQTQTNSIVERVINEPINDSVVYNDDYQVITISGDELSYTYSNLYSYILSITSNGVGVGDLGDYFSVVANSETLGNKRFERESFIWYGNNYELYFDSQFSYYVSSNESTLTSVEFTFDSGYNDFKSAMELDIQANQPSQNSMPSVSDLFGYITQGVTAFIGSLGEAFNSVVALFWTTGTNAGPTFLGLLMLVSIGAGLIFLAYNVIKKLVYRLRG